MCAKEGEGRVRGGGVLLRLCQPNGLIVPLYSLDLTSPDSYCLYTTMFDELMLVLVYLSVTVSQRAVMASLSLCEKRGILHPAKQDSGDSVRRKRRRAIKQFRFYIKQGCQT